MWIPFSEREPEIGKPILVGWSKRLNDAELRGRVDTRAVCRLLAGWCEYVTDEEWLGDDSIDWGRNSSPTHWMPWPEAPV